MHLNKMHKTFITLFYLIAIGVTSAQVKTFKVRGTEKLVTIKEGHCVADPTISHSPEQLKKIKAIIGSVGDKDIGNFSQVLGYSMSTSVSKGVDINQYLHGKIISFIGRGNENKNQKELIQSFWNTYNEEIVCRKEVPGISSRDTQHILKRLVDYRNTGFVKRFMNGRDFPLNPNTIELVNSKPETLLDYLKKITENRDKYKNYDYAEIESLKGFLKKSFGAKRANQILEIN